MKINKIEYHEIEIKSATNLLIVARLNNLIDSHNEREEDKERLRHSEKDIICPNCKSYNYCPETSTCWNCKRGLTIIDLSKKCDHDFEKINYSNSFYHKCKKCEMVSNRVYKPPEKWKPEDECLEEILVKFLDAIKHECNRTSPIGHFEINKNLIIKEAMNKIKNLLK